MKRMIWVGSSKKDLKEFPDEVQDEIGHALLIEQLGKKPNNSKVFSELGSANVREIKENDASGTYRAVYTVEKPEFVFVVHAFQKKSKSGKATPPKDLATIKHRLKQVEARYKEFKEGKQS